MSDWAGLPSRLIETDVALWRVHRVRNQPEWFNTDGTGRFDPPPAERTRFGSCYLGLDPLTAYVEVFGRSRAITDDLIAERALAELHLERPVRVADLTDRQILRFGLTAAHSTGTSYDPTQRLAGELFDDGFDGVHYRVRHDPAAELTAVALFGEPGHSTGLFAEVKSRPIPQALTDQAMQEFGIAVLPPAELP